MLCSLSAILSPPLSTWKDKKGRGGGLVKQWRGWKHIGYMGDSSGTYSYRGCVCVQRTNSASGYENFIEISTRVCAELVRLRNQVR